MSLVVLTHDPTGDANGSWWRASGYVFIRCALCDTSAILRDAPTDPPRADGTRGHDIAADGTVTPSIVCPGHRQGCTWHVWGRLDGWTP